VLVWLVIDVVFGKVRATAGGGNERGRRKALEALDPRNVVHDEAAIGVVRNGSRYLLARLMDYFSRDR
jgi:hypothetical protein